MDVLWAVVLTFLGWLVVLTVSTVAGEVAAGWFQLAVGVVARLLDVASLVRRVWTLCFPAPDWREQLSAEKPYTIE